jgi:hypothetical protein
MRPWVELVGVYTRTSRRLQLLSGRLDVTTRADLGEQLPSVDAIVVSVGIRQVPTVLDALKSLDTRHISLMLDTPVLDHRDLRSMRHFSSYREVLACEDAFALPPYVLAKQLVDQGAIGRLRYVHLFHSGYRFHALAALRQLTGRRNPHSIRFQRWNPWCGSVTIRFPGQVKATIIEPRHYAAGKLLIVGETGFIADYPIEHRKAIRIQYGMEDGRFTGLSLDGKAQPQSELDSAFVEGVTGSDLADSSLMNMLKIRGFMDLLAALGDEGIPFRYPATDSIYDSISLRVAQRTRVLKDVGLGRRTTLFGQAIRLAAALPTLR